MLSKVWYSEVRPSWRSVAQWLLTLTLLVPALLVGPAAPVTSQRDVEASSGQNVSLDVSHAGSIDPRLAQVALEQPEQLVRVIVQKVNRNERLEQLVVHLEGSVLTDLHIINAFAAEMSASTAYQLAHDPEVRWVSIDAPVTSTQRVDWVPSTPSNYFLDTLGIPKLWNMNLKGQGIGVAIVDSGIAGDADLRNVAFRKTFNPDSWTVNDVYGHGTHIAGIVAGNGSDSQGTFKGIAPDVSLISVKISDERGRAYESDSVAALQWVLDKRTTYNIRIVNLSISSSQESSYHTSALDAAVEVLWFNGIVVIAAAGNRAPESAFNPINAAPANDPFIITVGASDEKGTADPTNDIVAPFSARGRTHDGFMKPEIIAPGTAIYSVLSGRSTWDSLYPERCAVRCQYFRLSGTSMAAPMVVGVVALMLQDEPTLTPDQVKYRLTKGSARTLTTTWNNERLSFPYLNGYAAVTGTTNGSANTGLQASQLLWSSSNPVNWSSVNWNSVNWNSVNWNSTVLERSPDAVVVAGSPEEFMWEVPAWPEETAIPELDNHIFLPVLSQ